MWLDLIGYAGRRHRSVLSPLAFRLISRSLFRYVSVSFHFCCFLGRKTFVFNSVRICIWIIWNSWSKENTATLPGFDPRKNWVWKWTLRDSISSWPLNRRNEGNQNRVFRSNGSLHLMMICLMVDGVQTEFPDHWTSEKVIKNQFHIEWLSILNCEKTSSISTKLNLFHELHRLCFVICPVLAIVSVSPRKPTWPE
jgi:hypothetical protein